MKRGYAFKLFTEVVPCAGAQQGVFHEIPHCRVYSQPCQEVDATAPLYHTRGNNGLGALPKVRGCKDYIPESSRPPGAGAFLHIMALSGVMTAPQAPGAVASTWVPVLALFLK